MSNYKRLFIKGHNYIFFTIVTHQRERILIDNIELLRESFKYAKKKFNFEIFSIVVLHDHTHFILKLDNVNEYPKIIYVFKYYFSIHLSKNKNISVSKHKKGEKGIWQRRYWEHTIRDENDLFKHLDYIHFNPIKHDYVKCTQDWIYSSFNKFVNLGYYESDWCNFNDKNKINDLDFE